MHEFLDALKSPVAILGLAGQAAFFGRFVVQWIASEKHRRSVIPVAFWYLSVIGALLLLGYSWFRRDPIFLVGQIAAMGIYLRNLALLKRAPQAGSP